MNNFEMEKSNIQSLIIEPTYILFFRGSPKILIIIIIILKKKILIIVQ